MWVLVLPFYWQCQDATNTPAQHGWGSKVQDWESLVCPLSPGTSDVSVCHTEEGEAESGVDRFHGAPGMLPSVTALKRGTKTFGQHLKGTEVSQGPGFHDGSMASLMSASAGSESMPRQAGGSKIQ